MRPKHLARYGFLAVLGLALLIWAIAIDTALAVVLVIMASGLVLLIMPFVVIHYDQHQERMQRGGPGAHA